MQNEDLINSINMELKHLVKFRIRGVSESGGIIQIEQQQLNDVGYEIVIKPISKQMSVPITPIKKITKKINCYELATGKYIKTFNSSFEAQYIGNDRRYNSSNIVCCCNGKNKKTVDMIFLWENESVKDDLSDDFYIKRFGMNIEQYKSIVIDKNKKD